MKCTMHALAVLAVVASAVSGAAVYSADVDSRPFLKTHPRKSDLPLFSRVLQTLNFRGNDLDEWGLCEGDCDEDRDCEDGLICFQRDGTTSVPGCRGDGIPDVDYCIVDPDWEEPPSNLGEDFDQLEFLGDGLQGHGKCSGDCDKDEDCAGSLECFKRDDDEDVPGCGDGSAGKSGADYCYDPNDVVADKPTNKPTNKPTMKPSQKPTSVPTKSPTAAQKAAVRTDSPTLEPTLEPTREAAETVVGSPTPPVDDWWGPKEPEVVKTAAPTKAPVVVFEPEDIGVAVPPFVVGITFLTPTRRLGAQQGLANRYLLLAENIEKKEVNRVVEEMVEEKFQRKYPDTFNGIDLRSDFIDETEEDGMTTVSYRFAGQAVFYGDFVRQHQLPQSKDLGRAAIRALDSDEFTERLIESGDPILQAAQSTSAGEPVDLLAPVAQSSENDGVSVDIIGLVAVIVGCVLLLGLGAFILIRRQLQKGGNKLFSQRSVEEGADGLYNNDGLPSPTKTQGLDNSYEQQSEVGDYSVGYSESHAGDSVMDSVMDASSVGGRSDWSMMEGSHMASGYSTTDGSSFRVSGERQPSGKTGLLARRNIELMGTIRALEEVEIPAGGADQGRDEGSIAESSLDDNASALEDIKVSNVLQVDEVDTQVDAEDFKKVWKASSGGSGTKKQQQQSSGTSLDPKTMYQRNDDDDDSDVQPKGMNPEQALQEMIGVLNPASAVPVAAGTTVQDKTFDTISEAPSADEEEQSQSGSIIGSILGMLSAADKKEDDSIDSEPSEDGKDEEGGK